jgi:hypothetical protein
MQRFNEGDTVQVDIPDTTDPDFGTYHGEVGTVVDVRTDDAGAVTGDERDNTEYLVEFSDGDQMFFRWRDLRPE